MKHCGEAAVMKIEKEYRDRVGRPAIAPSTKLERDVKILRAVCVEMFDTLIRMQARGVSGSTEGGEE